MKLMFNIGRFTTHWHLKFYKPLLRETYGYNRLRPVDVAVIQTF